MSQAPLSRSQDMLSLDAESAAALDAALSALRVGKPYDCAALLAQFPHLGDALTALVITRRRTAVGPTAASSRSDRPYLIEGELGAGGFDIVYRAYDPIVN